MTLEELALLEVKPRTWWTAVRHFFGVFENGETLANGYIITGRWDTGYGGGSLVVTPEEHAAAVATYAQQLLNQPEKT